MCILESHVISYATPVTGQPWTTCMCHSHLGLAAWSRVGVGSLALKPFGLRHWHRHRVPNQLGRGRPINAVARLAAAVPKGGSCVIQ